MTNYDLKQISSDVGIGVRRVQTICKKNNLGKMYAGSHGGYKKLLSEEEYENFKSIFMDSRKKVKITAALCIGCSPEGCENSK